MLQRSGLAVPSDYPKAVNSLWLMGVVGSCRAPARRAESGQAY
jgi:hypothetical protein